MRGVSYLVMAALLVSVILIGYIQYFVYTSSLQISTLDTLSITDNFRNRLGLIWFVGDTVFLTSMSSEPVVIDSILMVYRDGSVYDVKVDLNVIVEPFKVSVIRLSELGLKPPKGLRYEDFIYIFVDEDGVRYVLRDFTGNTPGYRIVKIDLDEKILSLDGVISNVPIIIEGEYEFKRFYRWRHIYPTCYGFDSCIRMRPGSYGSGIYRVIPYVIYVNGTPVYIVSLSKNWFGRGSTWSIILDLQTYNRDFLKLLCGLDNGCDGTDDEYTVVFNIVGVMEVGGEYRLFYWRGHYEVEFEYDGRGKLSEIEISTE